MVGGLGDFLSKQEEVGEQEREDLVVWLRQVGSIFIPFIVLVCMYVCMYYIHISQIPVTHKAFVHILALNS